MVGAAGDLAQGLHEEETLEAGWFGFWFLGFLSFVF